MARRMTTEQADRLDSAVKSMAAFMSRWSECFDAEGMYPESEAELMKCFAELRDAWRDIRGPRARVPQVRDRTLAMASRVDSGFRMVDVAREFGVTRGAVWQAVQRVRACRSYTVDTAEPRADKKP